MVGVVKIVQHIDAATKNRVLVHHTQLAVKAAPAFRHQQAKPAQTRRQWRIHHPLHTGLLHFLLPRRRQRVGANAVHQHLDTHATPRGPQQCFGHGFASPVYIKNIGLELYP